MTSGPFAMTSGRTAGCLDHREARRVWMGLSPRAASPIYTAADYLDRSEFDNLPTEAQQVLQAIEINFVEGSPGRLSIQASSIGNWWFLLVEGNGPIRYIVRERRYAGMYMMVTIALSGRKRTIHAPWPRSGEVSLMPFDGPWDGIAAGEFRYLVAHIPQSAFDLEAEIAESPPLAGRSLSAFVGAGAILYANIRELAEQAKNLASRPQLERLLPDVTRLILSAFGTEQVDEATVFRSSDNVFGAILSYMEAHLGDSGLSPQNVAFACNISRRQLFRHFKDRGQSFSTTLRRMRLDQSREMLVQHPHIPVSEISDISGFGSPAYFCRVFTREVGRAPSRYRLEEMKRKMESADTEML